jgi:hypothetical protein
VAKKTRSAASKDNTLQAYLAQMEVQSIAGFLATLFNDEAHVHGSDFKVHYLLAHTLKGVDGSGRQQIFNLEAFNEGKIEKFNSNWGYVHSKHVYVATVQAFSHWTWHVSGGKLMVVDVQGVYDEHQQACTSPLMSVHSDCVKLILV